MCSRTPAASLAHDLTVIGLLSAVLYLRSDTDHFDVFVRLCDVAPNGRSTNLSDGFFRAGPESSVRDVDGVFTVRVSMSPTANTFKAGHRLRVQVSGERASALRRATWGRASPLRPRRHSGPHAMRSTTIPITRRCSISRSSRRQGRRVQQVGFRVASFQGDGVAGVWRFGELVDGARRATGRWHVSLRRRRPQCHRVNGLPTELGGTAANHTGRDRHGRRISGDQNVRREFRHTGKTLFLRFRSWSRKGWEFESPRSHPL